MILVCRCDGTQPAGEFVAHKINQTYESMSITGEAGRPRDVRRENPFYVWSQVRPQTDIERVTWKSNCFLGKLKNL